MVEIYKIKGEFVLPEYMDKPLVSIALGIGITPFISMLRYIKEETLDYKVMLIYSDSDRESMAFVPELEAMTKEIPMFKLNLVVNRHVDAEVVKENIQDVQNNLYFVSGPPGAVEAVNNALVSLNIPVSSIKTENFTGY